MHRTTVSLLIIISKGSRISIFLKNICSFIWLQWVPVVISVIFIALHTGRFIVAYKWSMQPLSLQCLGLVPPSHVGSYIPMLFLEAAISEAPEAKAGCALLLWRIEHEFSVARQILKPEFLWPPGMSCENQWFELLSYSWVTNIFIHNNHLL